MANYRDSNTSFGQKLKQDIDRTLAPGIARREARRKTNTAKIKASQEAAVARGTGPQRRLKSRAKADYYGIAKRTTIDVPRQQGESAKGQDGVTRTYDAATKTWKIQR